jgi:hypothetical protein
LSSIEFGVQDALDSERLVDGDRTRKCDL